MTLRPCLVAACLAAALSPAAAAPMRLALGAEGPQDLLLDAAPARPAVQYVAHGRPVAEPDTDNEAERGLAQAVDTNVPGAMLQSMAPEPAVAPDAPAHGWMAHGTDVDAAPLVDAPAAAAGDNTPLTDVAQAEPEADLAEEAAPAPTMVDEVEATTERRRLQRLAVQWTVASLVLVSLGLWWLLGRRRHRRRSDGSLVAKASRSSRHRGHRHARRAS